jgi:hypothetical protein
MTTKCLPIDEGGLSDEIRTRVRAVLGLEDMERFPTALPPRAEHLWRKDHFAGDIPFTNPMFVPVGPGADPGLLHKSIAFVVARHQALRTRLTLVDGRPIQIAEDWARSEIEITDISRHELVEDRPDAPENPVNRFTKEAMDLYAQDTFRCRAFRDENGDVTLGFLAHGYFSDAWSSQVLLKDFRLAYQAFKDSGTPWLAPARQYIDYAQSQRRSLAKDLPGHLGYWQKRLRAMPPLRLPYDYHGDHDGAHHKQTGKRGRSYFFIRQEFVERLAAVSAAAHVSLTLVLLAAFQLSLARWSGQRDILSAAYTADRVRPEFQNTIGFLVTNMPVLASLDPDQSFLSFLAGFAKDFYGSYVHRELSCEVYEAIFAPPQPFCPAVFNFVPLERRFSASELLSLPAFEGTLRGPDGARPAIYRDLYLGLAQYPNGLLGKLFYNADRFTPEGMERYVEHFRTVAEGIIDEPERRVSEILD